MNLWTEVERISIVSEICAELPNKFSCSDRYAVCKFTCMACIEFYIGQTSRTFKVRFKEHRMSTEKVLLKMFRWPMDTWKASISKSIFCISAPIHLKSGWEKLVKSSKENHLSIENMKGHDTFNALQLTPSAKRWVIFYHFLNIS